MNTRNLFVGGGIVAACLVVGILTFRGAEIRSVSFDKLASLPSGELCQVYGKLEAATIKPIKGAYLVEFHLAEEKTNRPLKVVYDNIQTPLPVTFPAASHAKATGTFDPVTGVFTASSVLTKCPSKYDEGGSVTVDQQKAMERFKAVATDQASADLNK